VKRYNQFINEELNILKGPSDDETYDAFKDLNAIDLFKRCCEFKLPEKFLDLAFEKNLLDEMDLNSILIMSVNTNYLIGVKFSLDKGADINYKTKKGYTSLIRAVDEGFNEIVKYLIDKGANINIRDNSGYTPLSSTIIHDDVNLYKYLIERGADTTVKLNNKTIYDIAKQMNSEKILDYMKIN
jgi:ankyrin repeat protein